MLLKRLAIRSPSIAASHELPDWNARIDEVASDPMHVVNGTATAMEEDTTHDVLDLDHAYDVCWVFIFWLCETNL